MKPHVNNAVRNIDARQAAAVMEGHVPDPANAIRNRDARQAAAVTEGRIPDVADAIRYRDVRQAGAVSEGFPTDDGNRLALDGIGNHQLPTRGRITVSDDD